MEGDDAIIFRQNLVRTSAHGRISMDEARAASATVDRMLIELIAKRRVEPGDDVLSGLIQAELDFPDGVRRPLTEREIVIMTKLVMLAGGGTSWRQMGITIWALLTHREGGRHATPAYTKEAEPVAIHIRAAHQVINRAADIFGFENQPVACRVGAGGRRSRAALIVGVISGIACSLTQRTRERCW